MPHLIGILMRQQHQRRQNRGARHQRNRQRDDKRLFTRRQTGGVAFLARENHFYRDQKENNPAGNGHGFGAQIQEREDLFTGKQENKHQQQRDQQLAYHNRASPLRFRVFQDRHENRQIA